jgi:hypothetical protein
MRLPWYLTIFNKRAYTQGEVVTYTDDGSYSGFHHSTPSEFVVENDSASVSKRS